MFLICWNFRGSFLSLIFSFWKFRNCILNQNSHLGGGVCFIKLFDLRPPYICFWFFRTLRGLFLVFFWFLKILELYFESEFPLLGGLFMRLFDLRPPYICFWYFGTIGGLSEFNFWFLKISKLYFESEFPLLGSVLKTFWFEVSLYMF